MNRYLLLILFILPNITFAQKQKMDVNPFLVRTLKVNDVKLTPDGNVVMATDKMLFEVSDMEVPMQLMDNKSIQSIGYGNRKLYAAGKNAIYEVFSGAEIPLQDPSATIKDMVVKNNLIYLATDKGIYIYSINTKKWSQLTSDNCDLKSNSIAFLMKDASSVWAGTRRGYAKINGQNLRLYDADKNVYAGVVDKNGVWLASDKSLTKISNGQSNDVKGYNRLKDGRVNALSVDKEGRLYIGSNVLHRYTPQSDYIEKYNAKDGINGKITNMQVDRKGNVWMATPSSGVFKGTYAKEEYKKLTAEVTLESPLRCTGDANAVVKAIVNGGRAPYTYEWDGKQSEGNTKSDNFAGNHKLKVTDSKGESTIVSYDIQNPPEMELSELIVKHTFNNKKMGSIMMTVRGGVGRINYKWSRNAERNAKYNHATKLGPGKYQVAAYDERKCIIEKSIEIESKAPTLANVGLSKGMVIRLPNLRFKADSSAVVSTHHKTLNGLVDALKEYPTAVIEVGGHTNTIPEDDFCNKLSEERAKNVANYIISKGIPKKQVQYKGYGKTQPRDRFRTTKSRIRNQRVEVKVIEL